MHDFKQNIVLVALLSNNLLRGDDNLCVPNPVCNFDRLTIETPIRFHPSGRPYMQEWLPPDKTAGIDLVGITVVDYHSSLLTVTFWPDLEQPPMTDAIHVYSGLLELPSEGYTEITLNIAAILDYRGAVSIRIDWDDLSSYSPCVVYSTGELRKIGDEDLLNVLYSFGARRGQGGEPSCSYSNGFTWGRLYGDVTRDGVVDYADLVFVIRNWNRNACSYFACRPDIRLTIRAFLE